MNHLVLAIATLLCATGCANYVHPDDDRGIPTAPTRTKSGTLLETDEGGSIYVRPAPTDIACLLGVQLAESDRGVVVVSCRRDSTGFLPGDVIVHVNAVTDPSPSGAAVENPPVPPAVPELHRRPRSHPVRRISDLAGYACGADWLRFEFGVERGGAERVVVGSALRERTQLALSHVDFDSKEQRAAGIDVAWLDWPLRQRPEHASPGYAIVTRVAKCSPAALAGLRPLDVLESPQAVEDLIAGKGAEVTSSSGKKHLVVFEATENARDAAWIPGVFSYQYTGPRRHVGIGPLDSLFHYSSHQDYEPVTDEVGVSWRLSILSTLQIQSRQREDGRGHQLVVFPGLDTSTLGYALHDWAGDLTVPRE